jgi:hypothetical protein
MIQKIYLTKGVNADDADFAIAEGQAKNLVNIRYGSTDDGRTAWLENIPSTQEITVLLPDGVNTVIGSAVDEENGRILWFNKNDQNRHRIYCYDNGNVYEALRNENILTGGLMFNNYIHSARVSDGILYWTDDDNEPQKFNYEAGIKANYPSFSTTQAPYVLPIDRSVLRLIRRPPAFPVELQLLSSQEPSFTKYEPTQYLYRYKYRDGETSVFSPLSDLINFNKESDTFNQVKIKIPLDEKIIQDVQEIEVAVKFLRSNKHFSIKTWNRTKDAALFTAHNAGTQLTYDFFNAQLGIAIDDPAAAKPFDNVPIKSKSLEIARNRLMLANNLKGYDAPSANISLTGSFSIPGQGSTLTGRWFKFTFRTTQGQGTLYLIDITGIGNDSGFYTVVDVTQPPFPANVYYNQCIFQGAGTADVFARYGVTFSDVIEFAGLGSTSVVLNGPVIETQIGQRIFKSDCPYQLGIVFFDHSGRKQMVTNESLTFRTPDRTLTNVSLTTQFNWALQSDPEDIPSWAEYYSVVITKALRTRFFMQLRADNMCYVTKDNNQNVYTTTAYSSTAFGVGVNIASLFSYNIGYAFSEGDLIKLWAGANIVTLNIKEQEGDWLVCDLQNLGTLNNETQCLYEIFTPHKSTQEFFYEIGKVYPVINPGLSFRTYSVTSDSIPGDVYVLERTNEGQHSVEAMSPNDKFWKEWYTAHGRPNLPDTIGQQRKKYSICWSNVYLNRKSNGYSSFDALDEKELDNEFGQIQKLQITSKSQEDGTVMLAICKNETASIYLGETALSTPSGSQFLAASPGVIGTINALRGSHGTNHPESVQEYRGLVFWWDENSGAVIQYSVNGLDPISMNKTNRVFTKLGRKGTPGLCIGGIDPKHNEYLLLGPSDGTSYGVFPTTTVNNETDMYNSPQRTWRFSFAQEGHAGSMDAHRVTTFIWA